MPQYCKECNRVVDDIEEHIQESHSDPDELREGKPLAEWIRDNVDARAEGDADLPDEAKTSIPASEPLAELGVRIDALKNVHVSTETGATLTPPEAKRMMMAIEDVAGFRIDRASFIVNLLDWGVRNSFSEELTDAGGFTVVSDPTVKKAEQYFKVAQLHNHINEFFGINGSGRSFTFRRFGRYLGKSIPKIIENNPTLNKYYVDGSPMSNRLGVAPALFLTTTSIFEYIKPYQKWSREEKNAWSAHNASITKVANTQNAEFLPADLRPSPSQASTMVGAGLNDFGRRTSVPSDMERYGKGASLFQRMMDNQGKTSFDS